MQAYLLCKSNPRFKYCPTDVYRLRQEDMLTIGPTSSMTHQNVDEEEGKEKVFHFSIVERSC